MNIWFQAADQSSTQGTREEAILKHKYFENKPKRIKSDKSTQAGEAACTFHNVFVCHKFIQYKCFYVNNV